MVRLDVAFDWEAAFTAACPFLQFLSADQLLELLNYCFFKDECRSLFAPSALPARRLLISTLHTLLTRHTITLPPSHSLLQLVQWLQVAQQLTVETGVDFFERYVGYSFTEIAKLASQAGLSLEMIDSALRRLEVVCSESHTSLLSLLSSCFDSLGPQFPPALPDLTKLADLYGKFVDLWRAERDDMHALTSLVLSKLQAVSPTERAYFAELCHFLNAALQVDDADFTTALTLLILQSIAPSIQEFQESARFGSVEQIAAWLCESAQTSDSSVFEYLHAVELLLEILGSPTVDCLFLKDITVASVTPWLDGKQCVLSNFTRTHFYDAVTALQVLP